MKTTVLLETMAGKGSEIGGRFEELAAIRQALKPEIRDKVGICLDTCHVHDGGYDIVNDLDGVLNEFDRIIGLEHLKALHINDSLNPKGAHKDRHAKIGEGHLGVETIVNVITHPKLKHVPFILETPNELDGYAAEIALLRAEAEKR
jgi:deoxyribonuclease-4